MPLFVMVVQLAPHRIVQLVSDHREAIGPDEILEAAIGVVISVILGYVLSLVLNRLHGGPELD